MPASKDAKILRDEAPFSRCTRPNGHSLPILLRSYLFLSSVAGGGSHAHGQPVFMRRAGSSPSSRGIAAGKVDWALAAPDRPNEFFRSLQRRTIRPFSLRRDRP